TSFISSTYWTERIGPTAALATIRKFVRDDVATHLRTVGATVQRGWMDAAKSVGLDVQVNGMEPLSHFDIRVEDRDVAATLFVQLMLEQGYLASTQLYASYAHTPAIITAYLDAVAKSFRTIADAIKNGEVRTHLRGPVRHSGFQRLT